MIKNSIKRSQNMYHENYLQHPQINPSLPQVTKIEKLKKKFGYVFHYGLIGKKVF